MILIIFYYLDVLLSDVESNDCEASTAEKCSSVVVQRPQLTNSIVNCFSSGGVSLSRYSKQLIEKGKSGNQKQLTPSNSEQATTIDVRLSDAESIDGETHTTEQCAIVAVPRFPQRSSPVNCPSNFGSNTLLLNIY